MFYSYKFYALISIFYIHNCFLVVLCKEIGLYFYLHIHLLFFTKLCVKICPEQDLLAFCVYYIYDDIMQFVLRLLF